MEQGCVYETTLSVEQDAIAQISLTIAQDQPRSRSRMVPLHSTGEPSYILSDVLRASSRHSIIVANEYSERGRKYIIWSCCNSNNHGTGSTAIWTPKSAKQNTRNEQNNDTEQWDTQTVNIFMSQHALTLNIYAWHSQAFAVMYP